MKGISAMKMRTIGQPACWVAALLGTVLQMSVAQTTGTFAATGSMTAPPPGPLSDAAHRREGIDCRRMDRSRGLRVRRHGRTV